MLLLALALQAAHMHGGTSTRIEVNPNSTLDEIPEALHKQHITVTDLAGPTIAYCERTGQTRCTNQVSAQSGGTSVTVCKVRGKWLVNTCGARKR